MTLTFTAHSHDRQATKADLLDIARALRVAVTDDMGLSFIREKLDQHLRAEGRNLPWDADGARWQFVKGHTSRQVTRYDLLGYMLALGPTGCSDKTPVPRLREILRVMLTRRAEQEGTAAPVAPTPDPWSMTKTAATERLAKTRREVPAPQPSEPRPTGILEALQAPAVPPVRLPEQPDLATLAVLAVRRARLNAEQRELNAQIELASAGKLHTQGCLLGGLFTGMGADVSGAECWCGQHDLRGV